MGESKHSPSPWRYLDYRVEDYKGEMIIAIGKSDERIPHSVAEANGHLVAAAPDLLEACIAAHSALGFPIDDESMFRVTNQLATAIAKARRG